MQLVSSMVAAIFGGIAGAIAGLIGDGFLTGLLPGVIAGGVVGFLFSLVPRSVEDPRIAVESFSPAGLIGGIAGSVAANTGLIGCFISCGAGWVLGLFLPAILMSSNK
ncbi:MAG: hypothetical protein ABWK15_06745 [Dissulfuribacterales bacterium]